MPQPTPRHPRWASRVPPAVAVVLLAACTNGAPTTVTGAVTSTHHTSTPETRQSTMSTLPMRRATSPALGSPPQSGRTPLMTDSARPSPSHSSKPIRQATAASRPSTTAPGTRPVIVLDPGHAPTISHTDPATGLNDSDYPNEPEMRDVFDIAQLVRTQLVAAGYQVVMTRNNVDDRVSLGQRAAIANNAHAALALSIHDQAGSAGGIGFTQGNNIVYYQTVGDYRQTPTGTKVWFTDAAVASTSRRYGRLFESERQAAEGAAVGLQGNTGYDLGSRGLAGGNIWMVQLLSKVPWIYNEAGGNSIGVVGLNEADKQRYATGLVAAVKRCVPIE